MVSKIDRSIKNPGKRFSAISVRNGISPAINPEIVALTKIQMPTPISLWLVTYLRLSYICLTPLHLYPLKVTLALGPKFTEFLLLIFLGTR